MPVDVLDGHRRVIHQDADRERKTAQCHDVERLANRREADDRAQHRERDRDRDDDGRAPASEKQQDHDAGQGGGEHALEGDAGDGAAHEDRLIAEQIDPERLRHLVLDGDNLLLDAGNDVEGRGRARLQHHHQHGTVAVDVDDIGLRRIAVADLRHVANINCRAVDDLDRQAAEFLDLQWRVVELDVVLEIADLLGADRGNQVLRGERVGDILPREAERLHRRGIDIDLDLALLAAERPRDRRPRHGDQRRPQLVCRDVEHVLFGQPLARQRKLDDRHRRCAVVEDQRRRRARRQLLEHRLRNGRDLRIRGADVDVRLEEDLDDAVGVVGIGDDVLDVVDGRGQRALERRDDAARHLVRRQAGVLPHHADHGNPDFREDVGRRPQGRERAYDQKKKGQHDESIGSAESNSDQRVHIGLFSVILGATVLPQERPVLLTLFFSSG